MHSRTCQEAKYILNMYYGGYISLAYMPLPPYGTRITIRHTTENLDVEDKGKEKYAASG